MNNSSGFQNESSLSAALNGKLYCNLSPNLQNLISCSFLNKDGIISCLPRGGNWKVPISLDTFLARFLIKPAVNNGRHF